MKRNIVKQSDIYMKLYQSKNMSIIQIYPVSEGYLREKKTVERRGKFPEPRNFSCP
jgi:hypothetical protein